MYNIVYVFNGDKPPSTAHVNHVANKPELDVYSLKVDNFGQAYDHWYRNASEIDQVFLSVTAPDNAREFFGNVPII